MVYRIIRSCVSADGSKGELRRIGPKRPKQSQARLHLRLLMGGPCVGDGACLRLSLVAAAAAAWCIPGVAETELRRVWLRRIGGGILFPRPTVYLILRVRWLLDSRRAWRHLPQARDKADYRALFSVAMLSTEGPFSPSAPSAPSHRSRLIG